MAAAIAALVTGTAPGPPVAAVAGEPLSEEDVRAHLVGEPSQASVWTAVREAADAHILRAEAERHLASDRPAAGDPRSDPGSRLLSALFAPGQLCRSIPEPLRRKRFEDTLWRFRMPPSWRVSSIGWPCCRGSACDHPDAAACLDESRRVLERLRAELPDHSTDLDFGAAFDAAVPYSLGLRFRRYSFSHDPERPDEPVHRRLRTAPPAIAKAVVSAEIGQIIGPIATRTGHYILRLRERRPRIALAWADERTQAVLRTELCPEVWLRARRQYVADLRRQLPLRIDLDAVEAAFGVRLSGD